LSEHPFERLVEIMRTLLGPDGCPWDREQTPATLKPYLIEEIYEVCESIDQGDAAALREELGDVLMHIIFLSLLAEQSGDFRLPQVIDGIADKMVKRHPHVFGAGHLDTADQVVDQWERIKAEQRQSENPEASRLDGVPRALPALLRSHRLQEKAAKVGFDWGDVKDVWAKVREEIDELEEALTGGDPERAEDEFGDLLFVLVNLGRWKRLNAESALQRTNAKFERRFRHIEARARETGRVLDSMTLAEMDALWEEAKESE
jgi:tetrapyrrole methylase family protein/MazG family protein